MADISSGMHTMLTCAKLADHQVYDKDGLLIFAAGQQRPIRDQRPISPCTTCCIYNGIDTKFSALHTRQRKSKLLSIYYSLTGGTYASNYGETGSRVIR